jgi:hypothetical protein
MRDPGNVGVRCPCFWMLEWISPVAEITTKPGLRLLGE